jgi:hypothetical protein
MKIFTYKFNFKANSKVNGDVGGGVLYLVLCSPLVLAVTQGKHCPCSRQTVMFLKGSLCMALSWMSE